MSDWAVTVNLGGERQRAACKDGMLDWTRDVFSDEVRRPAIIFAQETFKPWLELVEGADYKVIKGVDRRWRVHSAIVHRPDVNLERLDDTDLPNLSYHGNYVAAARWRQGDGPGVILASVHASPAYAEPDTYGWPNTADKPEPRDGGNDPRWPGGRLWDSDFLLQTITDLHRKLAAPVLAAGDFNESLLDDPDGGTWAREYFGLARQRGICVWLHETWGTAGDPAERATRRGLQLDHVLVTDDARGLLTADPMPYVDPRWHEAGATDRLSDHAPVWFRLAPGLGLSDAAGDAVKRGKTVTDEGGQTL